MPVSNKSSRNNIEVCPIPTKEVDNAYALILESFGKYGPANDPMFQKALSALMKTSPSKAYKAHMQSCAMAGGLRKAHRSRKGGMPVVEAEAAPVPVAETIQDPNSKRRFKCYIKVMLKIALAVAGTGAVSYYMVYPYVMSAIPWPCTGITDQMFGMLTSIVDAQTSCSSRQKKFDTFVDSMKIAGGLAGVSIPGLVWRSPQMFKQLLKYMLHKECPELFEAYSKEQLQTDFDALKKGSAVSSQAAAQAPARGVPQAQQQEDVPVRMGEQQYDGEYGRQEGPYNRRGYSRYDDDDEYDEEYYDQRGRRGGKSRRRRRAGNMRKQRQTKRRSSHKRRQTRRSGRKANRRSHRRR